VFISVILSTLPESTILPVILLRLLYIFKAECFGKGTKFIIFTMARHPLVGQGLLVIEASRSHSDTPHLVGLLWMSDQLDAEIST